MTCPRKTSLSRRLLSPDFPSPPARLEAPAAWRVVDLISDLHLHSGDAATLHTLTGYLAHTPADALCILGDLFEVWVGDDCLVGGSFELHIAQILREASTRMPIYLMHGNRDFLLGPAGLQACGAQALQDPTILAFSGQSWLLSHGDALCLADTAYMAFRAQVRSPSWQSEFLARPLPERQALALAMRSESSARKQTVQVWADVDSAAVVQWLAASHCPTLIHGHTHKPADHALGQGLQRMVLSDWDAGALPPRAEVLRLTASGAQRIALS